MTANAVKPQEVDSCDAVWKDLCAIFKKVSLTNLSWTQIRLTFNAYGRSGNDHISLNLQTEQWREALSCLGKVNKDELGYLSELSQINIELLDPHVKRKAALYFGFYPAIFAGSVKYFGDVAISFLWLYFVFVSIGALMFLNFYQNRWQAGELGSCIKLALARQSLRAAMRDQDVKSNAPT
jgi:hypothetical protein